MPNQNKLDSIKRNLDANILNVESLLRSKFGPDIIPESYDNVIVSFMHYERIIKWSQTRKYVLQ